MKKNHLKKKVFVYTLLFLFIFSALNSFADTSLQRGDYNYTDNRPASQNPPGGLLPSQVPQFVVLGFDDNNDAGGMQWVIDYFASKKNPPGTGNAATFDGSPAKITFYYQTTHMSNPSLKQVYSNAVSKGFEAGSHTNSHPSGLNFSVSQWESEMTASMSLITSGLGVPANNIYGFRAPFLDYNTNIYPAAKNKGLWYDCSIEEGWQDDQDGTNYLWPYTLDNGSPGNKYEYNKGNWPNLVGNYPGVWELPVYTVIVPPDDKCASYGVPTGLRNKMKGIQSKFNVNDGKIVGFDWNLWYDYSTTRAEYVATLKYSFDQRLKGNRAPFTFGVHSNYYNTADRQAALKEFIDYVLTKPEVRVVSAKQMLDWLRNPVPLDGSTPTPTQTPTPTKAPGYSITGFVKPDFSIDTSIAPTVNSGFKVELEGTGIYATTGSNGYFELSNVPASKPGYTLKISKPAYLTRQAANIVVTNDVVLSTEIKPIDMWAGDVNQDNVINMADVVEVSKCYNSTVGSDKYNESIDFDRDGAINMSDIMILVRHFNKLSTDYPLLTMPVVTPTFSPTATPTAVVTITPTPTPTNGVTYPPWDPNRQYAIGDRVSYEGNNYECMFAHTSNIAWTPIAVPTLWKKL